MTSVAEFKDFLRDQIARRPWQRTPDQGEILSKLVAASELGEGGGDTERLSEAELLHNCIFLLNAGHETTTNLIGNGVDLLLRNPDAMRELAANPGLIETAVEEFLRMESSNQLGNRRAAVDATVGGIEFRPARTCTCASAPPTATRRSFAQPDRLDLSRNPNRHLAFGSGIHICAGNSLARMEAQVAIGKLVARFKTIERAGDFVRGGRARFRGFLRYPVKVG